jgi:hypothetical protein
MLPTTTPIVRIGRWSCGRRIRRLACTSPASASEVRRDRRDRLGELLHEYHRRAAGTYFRTPRAPPTPPARSSRRPPRTGRSAPPRTLARQPGEPQPSQGVRKGRGPAGRPGPLPPPARQTKISSSRSSTRALSSCVHGQNGGAPLPPSSHPTTRGSPARSRVLPSARPTRSCRSQAPQRSGTAGPGRRSRPPGRQPAPPLPGPGPQGPAVLRAGQGSPMSTIAPVSLARGHRGRKRRTRLHNGSLLLNASGCRHETTGKEPSGDPR